MIDPEPVASVDYQLRRCSASTRLTASESARVAGLPARSDPMVGALVCELVTGHDAWHVVAVAASGGERWWWLRWVPNLRELYSANTCEATQTDGPQDDWCLLPQGHPGPHSYNIQP